MEKHFDFFFRRSEVSLLMFNSSLLGLNIRRNKDTRTLSLFLKIEYTRLVVRGSLQNWLAYFPSTLMLGVWKNATSTNQASSWRLETTL